MPLLYSKPSNGWFAISSTLNHNHHNDLQTLQHLVLIWFLTSPPNNFSVCLSLSLSHTHIHTHTDTHTHSCSPCLLSKSNSITHVSKLQVLFSVLGYFPGICTWLTSHFFRSPLKRHLIREAFPDLAIASHSSLWIFFILLYFSPSSLISPNIIHVHVYRSIPMCFFACVSTLSYVKLNSDCISVFLYIMVLSLF